MKKNKKNKKNVRKWDYPIKIMGREIIELLRIMLIFSIPGILLIPVALGMFSNNIKWLLLYIPLFIIYFGVRYKFIKDHPEIT